MPICKTGGRTSSSAASKSRASSVVGGRSRASTAPPDENDDDDGEDEGAFVFLRDPSKMQKHEIQACFTHWMARQERGQIRFEFSHVLNSREGTLRPAIRLEELSDLGDTESDAPATPPRNAPRRRWSKKARNTLSVKKRGKQKGPAVRTQPTVNKAVNGTGTSHIGGLLAPALPDGGLQLEWDPMLDPMLQQRLPPVPHATLTMHAPSMLGTGGGPSAAYVTDPDYAAHLARIERGGPLMTGVVPAWMGHSQTYQPAEPTLRPAIRRRPGTVDVLTGADGWEEGRPTPTDTTIPDTPLEDPLVGTESRSPAGHQVALPVIHEHNNPTVGPPTTSGGRNNSPVPDYTKRWMRTRSTSRPRNTEGSEQREQRSEGSAPEMGGVSKRKRGPRDIDNSDVVQSGNSKKAKSVAVTEGTGSQGEHGRRPKPRPKPRPAAGMDSSVDSFDLRHRRTA